MGLMTKGPISVSQAYMCRWVEQKLLVVGGGPDCHLHMRRLRHLRMPTSLVHARASTTSLVHAHTFWVGWVGWAGWVG